MSSDQQHNRQSPKRPDRRRDQLSGAQIMFAAIIAIGLILAINFSTRLASSRPLNAFYQDVQAEIDVLEQEQATLIAERDFVESDAFVEEWARSDGKMVRPGEVLVVPLTTSRGAPPTPTPQVFIEVETSPPEPEAWELWWALFFDGDPPDF